MEAITFTWRYRKNYLDIVQFMFGKTAAGDGSCIIAAITAAIAQIH